MLNEGDVLGPV